MSTWNDLNGSSKVVKSPKELSSILRNVEKISTEADAVHLYLRSVFRRENITKNSIFDSLKTITAGIRNRLKPNVTAALNK